MVKQKSSLNKKVPGACFCLALGQASYVLNLLGGISAAVVFERLVGGKYIG